mgnify:CR=1 FL=1
MKITIIAPYPVYPVRFGGQARIWGLAKGYANIGHKVTVLCNTTYQFPKAKTGTIDGVHIVIIRTWIQDLVAYLATKKIIPLIASYPINSVLGFLFQGHWNDSDVVIFEQPFLAGWSRYVSNSLTVYSAQNVEEQYDLNMFDSSWHKSLFFPLLKKCEAWAVRQTDILFSCSEQDLEYFRKEYSLADERVFIVENGYDPQIKSPAADIKHRREPIDHTPIALFIGSHSLPNIEAAQFITSTIAPELPEWTFRIVGESANFCTPHTQNVQLVGEVKNIDNWTNDVSVGLLPLSSGSGSSLKLLEYLHRGIPVICTDVGLRGFTSLRKYIRQSKKEEFVNLLRKRQFSFVPLHYLEGYKWRDVAGRSIKFLQERM